MSQTELWAAAQFLYTTLNVSGITTLATGGVHRDIVTPSQETPYVVIDMEFNDDTIPMSSGAIKRAFNVSQWSVYVVGTLKQGQTVNQIARAIDDLLQRESGSTSDGFVITCVRLSEIFETRDDEGVTHAYGGGRYKIWSQAT